MPTDKINISTQGILKGLDLATSNWHFRGLRIILLGNGDILGSWQLMLELQPWTVEGVLWCISLCSLCCLDIITASAQLIFKLDSFIPRGRYAMIAPQACGLYAAKTFESMD